MPVPLASVDDGRVQDLAAVHAAFIDPQEFWSSPLCRRLSAVVAADPFLVALAAHARAGQGPTFAFFGAVHAVLLGGAQHELADYYPSLCGPSAQPADERAGVALVGLRAAPPRFSSRRSGAVTVPFLIWTLSPFSRQPPG